MSAARHISSLDTIITKARERGREGEANERVMDRVREKELPRSSTKVIQDHSLMYFLLQVKNQTKSHSLSRNFDERLCGLSRGLPILSTNVALVLTQPT